MAASAALEEGRALPALQQQRQQQHQLLQQGQAQEHEEDPRRPVDAQNGRFPHCIVWTPLPIVSWLSPLIGHVGICRADGVILDFAGPYFINVDNFAFGAAAKYVQLDVEQCCFPPHLSGHSCCDGFGHSKMGTAASWDDALCTCTHKFQHKAYNFFTCNCHSFVSACLNRVAYRGSLTWDLVKVMVLVHSKGRWVSNSAALRSFAPFLVVLSLGLLLAGWPFLLAWAAISTLFVAWFLAATYCHCLRGLVES